MTRALLIALIILSGCTQTVSREQLFYALKQRDDAMSIIVNKIMELDNKVNPPKKEK